MSELSKIMDKIQKCMALGDSDNPHEAAQALKRARQLMDKHNLTQDWEAFANIKDVELVVDFEGTNHPFWHQSLTFIVAQAFGCTSYNGRRRVQFVGPAHRVEGCVYCFEVIKRQLMEAKKKYAAEYTENLRPHEKGQASSSFMEGWCIGVLTKVEEFAQAVPAEEKKNHIHYTERKHGVKVGDAIGKPTSIEGSNNMNALHKFQGLVAAEDAQLFHGVGESSLDKLT